MHSRLGWLERTTGKTTWRLRLSCQIAGCYPVAFLNAPYESHVRFECLTVHLTSDVAPVGQCMLVMRVTPLRRTESKLTVKLRKLKSWYYMCNTSYMSHRHVLHSPQTRMCTSYWVFFFTEDAQGKVATFEFQFYRAATTWMMTPLHLCLHWTIGHPMWVLHKCNICKSFMDPNSLFRKCKTYSFF